MKFIFISFNFVLQDYAMLLYEVCFLLKISTTNLEHTRALFKLRMIRSYCDGKLKFCSFNSTRYRFHRHLMIGKLIVVAF